MTKKTIAIHWFRQDLRLSDNPALTKACEHDGVMPVYILDDQNAGDHAMGAASRWWLHHSLRSLGRSLDGNLSLYSGDPLAILSDLISRYGVSAVYWNRCYEPWCIDRDTAIKQSLASQGITVESFNGSLLWEPWDIRKNDGTPYKVFTPFYRKGCMNAAPPREPLPEPEQSQCLYDKQKAVSLESLGLLPDIPWDQQLASHWHIGTSGANARLQAFIEQGLGHYKGGRDRPARAYTSRLSPHLHFGELSPNQVWYTVRSLADNEHVDHFCSELGWREFSYAQLYFNPTLPKDNLQSKFDSFPWENNETLLMAWQKGMTGIPLVDAGMRELWQTGSMHNRLRMVVASFLVKNLLIHWHHGERWFWDTLVDADLANNSASWQWVAGCGADAAPYFRIFNPVAQGHRFDPQGEYVRQYVPELSALPDKYLFDPWLAPESVLRQANIVLGSTYPKPIVDLKVSRNKAMEAFQSLAPGS
ncbi:deoxyribodipyrimidine photo-lyase [Candidatus Sororendozoicomonas aggregata]|uniref:cryptochrome/photolyase family protein n=1 Tax=Candidatus Sororendozoicomonas aggregata TaxID=3073239 RepID=UPI002ED19DAC